MLWFKPSFKKKFRKLTAGLSCGQVWELLGPPQEAEDSGVPLDSKWGLQPSLAFKIRPGEPVRQWVYESKGQFYYLWFAKVAPAEEDPWRVTLKKTTPRKL